MTIRRQIVWGAAFLLVTMGAVLGHAQSTAKLPSDLDPDSRARLPYLQKKDMDERGQKTFDTLPGRGQDGVLRGPLAFAAYNPGVAQASSISTTLPSQERSTRTCASWRSWSPAVRPITASNGTRTRRAR